MTWLVRRLFHFAIVIWGVTTLVFVALRLTGDPAMMLLPGNPTMAEVELAREKLGVNKPLITQYGAFIGDAFRGRFGTSFLHGVDATGRCARAFAGYCAARGFCSAFSSGLRHPAGHPCRGVSRNHCRFRGDDARGDRPRRAVLLARADADPYRRGRAPPSAYRWLRGGDFPAPSVPSLTLAGYIGASTARLARSSMLEVLGRDYMRTARAKGLALHVVVLKHGLKNAAIPLVTFLGLQMGLLLGGTVVVEEIFGWPGVGRLLLQAISFRDYPVVQAATFILAMIFVLVNILVDLVYVLLDPRVRDQR